MNSIKILKAIFFIGVIVVLYSIITTDIDLFIWAAASADIAGITFAYLTIKSNKAL
jgi:hypothetical protein